MTGVANGDGTPARDLFGYPLPAGTGAAGSTAPRTLPPDRDLPAGQWSGRPGSGTAQPLSAGPGESASTSLPGQTAVSIISPGPAEGYISTGATGTDHADHWPRYDWQSQPQRNG